MVQIDPDYIDGLLNLTQKLEDCVAHKGCHCAQILTAVMYQVPLHRHDRTKPAGRLSGNSVTQTGGSFGYSRECVFGGAGTVPGNRL